MKIEMTGLSVYIGTPVDNPIPHETCASFMETVSTLSASGIKWTGGFERSGFITVARDNVLDSFLKSDMQKLFMIDSDMVWSANEFMKLLALSTVKDVVCAGYPSKMAGQDNSFICHFGDFDQKIDEYGTCRIRGTGLGFTVIDRKVAEAMVNGAPHVVDAISGRKKAMVFRTDVTDDGFFLGEDIAFFDDVAKKGFEVWLCPDVDLGHIGEKQWRGKVISALQADG